MQLKNGTFAKMSEGSRGTRGFLSHRVGILGGSRACGGLPAPGQKTGVKDCTEAETAEIGHET